MEHKVQELKLRKKKYRLEKKLRRKTKDQVLLQE